jgi:ubiquitin carboxyl-terminal hydrolase 34
LEFNDSQIKEFDLKNFDEACFGSGTGNDSHHDEFDTMANKFDRLNSNKSAYILVYERKQKSNLKFQFNDENIDQKADIINNLIKKENLDPSVLTDDKNMELEIGFNDINKYMPAKYYNEILEDNFKFQTEQQIYTREF